MKEDFINFFKDDMNTRVELIETVVTDPDIDSDGNIVPETGGRHDVFFRVHDEDIMRFAIPRLTMGIKWWEDVVGNNSHTVYPTKIIKKYINEA